MSVTPRHTIENQRALRAAVMRAAAGAAVRCGHMLRFSRMVSTRTLSSAPPNLVPRIQPTAWTVPVSPTLHTRRAATDHWSDGVFTGLRQLQWLHAVRASVPVAPSLIPTTSTIVRALSQCAVPSITRDVNSVTTLGVTVQGAVNSRVPLQREGTAVPRQWVVRRHQSGFGPGARATNGTTGGAHGSHHGGPNHSDDGGNNNNNNNVMGWVIYLLKLVMITSGAFLWLDYLSEWLYFSAYPEVLEAEKDLMVCTLPCLAPCSALFYCFSVLSPSRVLSLYTLENTQNTTA